jgi:threonylcarbamoyladenosine tRNA methylthiotransferase MtaB
VVLGCLAERAPERLRAIPGIAEVWDNRRKQQEIAGTCPSPGRSRALLKVQDGCSRRCRFCIVSGLRGSPLSVPAEQVVEQFNSLVAEGFTEVVLSGLNLGTYHDRGMSLAGLVERLLGQPSACRIRLGSIEPDTVGPALVELISSPRLCPHLHLPLQSGDDALLRAMCRPYNTGAYRQLLDQLLRVRPEMNLGADVIVGFPSEDDASFARTMAFLTSSPLCYLHVFPFSPRPGVEVPGPRPATAATRARVQVLRDLSLGRNHAYARRFIGTVRPAVVETARTALTDNYLRVGLTCPLPARSAVHLRITSEGDRLLGCPI